MKEYLSKILKSNNKNTFKASAIVACFNGQSYIEKRLQSIINQSIKPYEILFLDDASTDDSLLIAKRMLRNCKIKYKIFENKENIGCGDQLIKGLNMANGNFIWFAEQDDYCNDGFLAQMKSAFKDPAVNMAYCKSIPVDKQYNELPFYYKKEEQLETSYLEEGTFEVINKLCIRNTIYDLSSVVFRKSALTGIEEFIPDYRVFYDWILYVYALRNGKICYDSECFNYHMRHSDSIIAKKRQSSSFYKDLFAVKNYIIDHYKIPKYIMREMLFEIDRDYRQYGCRGYDSPDIMDHPILANRYTELQNKIENCENNHIRIIK